MSLQFTASVRTAVVGIILACLGPVSYAADYDLTLDFSTANNPNGAWSFGLRDTLSSAFQLFDSLVTTEGGDIERWVKTGYGNIPLIAKNVSSTNYFGVPGGSVFAHPGNGNEFVEVRFTAPGPGNFSINAQFFAGDAGNTDVLVALNDDIAMPLFIASSTGSDPQFITDVDLDAGETLGFIIGADGERSFDSTPIAIKISSTAVPEPASAMLMAGASMIAAFRRRRKAMAR